MEIGKMFEHKPNTIKMSQSMDSKEGDEGVVEAEEGRMFDSVVHFMENKHKNSDI